MDWNTTAEVDLSPWPDRDDPWAATTWAAQSFAPLQRRARAVFGAVGEALSPTDADAIARDLLPLLHADERRAHAGELLALCEHVRWLRRRAGATGLERLELTVVALDATHRFLSPNPLVYAVDAMGWRRVPRSLASFAVDLGLLVRSWRIGRNDIAPAKSLWHLAAGLGRVVATAHEAAGVCSELEWPRALQRATQERPRLGARWMGGGFTYLLEVLERLPQTEPRNLAIYEALADEADQAQRVAVERATAVFVRTLGSARLEASTALRAAIRRVVAGDHDGAMERALEAFERMSGIEEPLGACCAALVLVSLCEHDEHARLRWLEHAVRYARGRERPRVQLALLGTLAAARERAGDELGVRRILVEAHLLSELVPEILIGLPLEWWASRVGEPHGEPEDAEGEDAEPEGPAPEPKPSELETVRRLLRRGKLWAAYEELGGCIADLLERFDRATVTGILLRHAHAYDEDSVTAPLLAAWSCAAVADLVEEDHDAWCASKALQLTLEDRIGVTEDDFALERGWFQLATMPERRVAQCIEEGKRALHEGQAQRARFWIDRAQDYRARMKA